MRIFRKVKVLTAFVLCFDCFVALPTFLMNYANAQQGSWQTLAAGIIIIMLPSVLLYLFFQRYILSGIVAGAVKE